LKALLARKKPFEGPKSGFEYLEGAAGPKKAIRDKFDQKIPSKEQTSLGGTKEWSTKNLEGNPVKRPSECKGYIPLRFRKNFYQSLPFESKRINLPKETRHC
jgi:hypothetical protein